MCLIKKKHYQADVDNLAHKIVIDFFLLKNNNRDKDTIKQHIELYSDYERC